MVEEEPTRSRDQNVGTRNLFAEMSSCIKRQIRVQGSKQADRPRNEIAVPACAILEVREYIFGVMLLFREARQDADDDEIPNDVEHKD